MSQMAMSENSQKVKLSDPSRMVMIQMAMSDASQKVKLSDPLRTAMTQTAMTEVRKSVEAREEGNPGEALCHLREALCLARLLKARSPLMTLTTLSKLDQHTVIV